MSLLYTAAICYTFNISINYYDNYIHSYVRTYMAITNVHGFSITLIRIRIHIYISYIMPITCSYKLYRCIATYVSTYQVVNTITKSDVG